MSEKKPTIQRWYDRKPEIAQAIASLSTMPYEVQSIIGEGIIMLAERDYQAHELMRTLPRLGLEKMLGIKCSNRKKRGYDNNPMTHKAVNYVYILSYENQELISQQIVELSTYITEYLKTCRAFNTEPTPEELSQITQSFLDSGSDEVRRFIYQYREQFIDNIAKKINQYPKLNEFLSDTRYGMRLQPVGAR
jgi:hypothetical protein